MAKSPSNETDEIVVVGAVRHPLRDIYHLLLTTPWWGACGAIATAFFALNAIFAVGYLITGGIYGAEPGSFGDAFFFSAQTLGTIGYGAMHPMTTAANLLAVVESVFSIIFIAISTGLVFARFSRSSEALVFADHPCIALMDGVPTLVMRVGNDRRGAIMDATVRITMFRTHHTAEGVLMYRMKDLVLARERTPALGRTFTVMHHITKDSPIFEMTPETFERDEIEFLLNVVGTDGTSLQPVYGRRRYLAKEVLWGARLADVLTELADGRLQLDVRRFHDVEATEASDEFPYSAKLPAKSSSAPSPLPDEI